MQTEECISTDNLCISADNANWRVSAQTCVSAQTTQTEECVSAQTTCVSAQTTQTSISQAMQSDKSPLNKSFFDFHFSWLTLSWCVPTKFLRKWMYLAENSNTVALSVFSDIPGTSCRIRSQASLIRALLNTNTTEITCKNVLIY